MFRKEDSTVVFGDKRRSLGKEPAAETMWSSLLLERKAGKSQGPCQGTTNRDDVSLSGVVEHKGYLRIECLFL